MAFVAHGERFRIVAASTAHFAHHVNVGKKIHFDAAEAVALAGFAAAAFYVEAKPAGAIAALTRFRKHGKEIADRSHTAIEPRDLYRCVRSDPRSLCHASRIALPRPSPLPVYLQREKRALPNLP